MSPNSGRSAKPRSRTVRRAKGGARAGRPTEASTTVILAAEHEVVRRGLRAILEGDRGFSVVAEASDGLVVSSMVKGRKPDILIVDLRMESLGGIDMVRQVRRSSPQTRVIIFSMVSKDGYVLQALRNGASAYVTKSASADEIILAVREVAAGRLYLSPPFTDLSVESYPRKAHPSSVDPYATLTERERAVFHLAAEGLTSAEIAVRLGISRRTAEGHRFRIMHKLSLRGQTDLVREALRRGAIVFEEDDPQFLAPPRPREPQI